MHRVNSSESQISTFSGEYEKRSRSWEAKLIFTRNFLSMVQTVVVLCCVFTSFYCLALMRHFQSLEFQVKQMSEHYPFLFEKEDYFSKKMIFKKESRIENCHYWKWDICICFFSGPRPLLPSGALLAGRRLLGLGGLRREAGTDDIHVQLF